jgi:beta-glucosidase
MGRIDSLLAAMTLEEKVGQLTMIAAPQAITGPSDLVDITEEIRKGRAGAVLNVWGAETRRLQRVGTQDSRLGIPLLVCLDVIHGHRTIFPVPLAEASAMDPDLWQRSARVAAEEAAEDGVALTFAPVLDVARDPRWGRIVESPGEDSFIASMMAIAKIRGFQGEDLARADGVAATAKHLCGYGAVSAGREYASAEVSERTLREVYLPPFEAAVGAGTAAVMPAFIDVAGIPMTINAPLLKSWLRDRQGFGGVVISDYNAVAELLAHGVAADLHEAAALALAAGVDVDMASGVYLKGLPVAIDRGLVEEKQIDASVRRVLALKERLGLFENPFGRGRSDTPDEETTRERRRAARQVAGKAIVLLTNRNSTLPLSPHVRRIALVGPLAAARGEMLGPWALAGDALGATTVREGMSTALPGCRIDYAPGVEIDSNDESGVAGAVALCSESDAVVLCLGESAAMSGEAASRADLCLPGRQRVLAEAVLALGKPVIACLSSGRPLTLPWLIEKADAVLATWFLGSEAGAAIADVLTGNCNPSGRLPISWPRHVGQTPIYFSQRPSGRPAATGVRYSSAYIDVPVTPQFVFGHGLSYSSFSLHDLRCQPPVVRDGESVEASVAVSNISEVDGEATLFLFVRDPVASVARPALELKGFRKIALAAGETAQLEWRLTTNAFRFIGADLESVLEPGRIEIHVGLSADPAKLLSAEIEVAP